MHPASRPAGDLAALVRPNRLSCRFVVRPKCFRILSNNVRFLGRNTQVNKNGPTRGPFSFTGAPDRIDSDRPGAIFTPSGLRGCAAPSPIAVAIGRTNRFSSTARPTKQKRAPDGDPILFGAPDRIRTCDPQIRNLVLYPTELRALAESDSSKVTGLAA